MEQRVIDAAGGLVSNPQGEYLMIFRRGVWDLPKGKLEEGEKIEYCAVREVSEETGLEESRISLGDPICTTVHYYDLDGQKIEKHTHWYKMFYSPAQGEQLRPQTVEDITSAVWVSPAQARINLENTFETIRDVFRKAGILE